MRELYIEEVKPEIEEKNIKYKWIENLYDETHKVCVRKISLNKKLELEKLYAFSFIDDEDEDTYHYIVLKIEADDIYYISEYYDGLITTKESHLVENAWTKCNVNLFGINLDKYEVKS